MCRAFAVLVALALVRAPALRAQPTSAEVAAQAAQVARLESEWRAAARAADSAEARRTAERRLTDTVRVGALVVLASPEAAAAARDAAASAWGSIDSTFGAGAGDAGAPVFFLAGLPAASGIDARWEYGFIENDRPLESRFARDDPGEAFRAFVLQALESRLTDALDPPFVAWIGTRIFGGALERDHLSRPYVSLATHPARPARECLAGRVASCALVLDLRDDGDPLLAFYDARARRALVRPLEPWTRTIDGAPHTPAWIDCVERQRDAACVQYLRDSRDAHVPLHLDHVAREVLVRQALIGGGREAYRRLRASAGRPVLERLAIASGRSADDLLTHWRATIVGARPAPVTLSPASAWVAFGWAVALGVLALRSSRWR